MNFDATNIKDFRARLASVLEAEFPELRFELGRITYAGEYAKVAMEAIAGKSQAETDLETMMQRHGISSRTNARGEKLIAYSRRARKYPYIMENAEGKKYKLAVYDALDRFAS